MSASSLPNKDGNILWILNHLLRGKANCIKKISGENTVEKFKGIMKWNFNCFTGGNGSKPVKQSFKRRVKNDRKSSSLKPKTGSDSAGERRGTGEGFVRIVSFSDRGEVSPVTFVSSITKSSHEKVATTFDAQISVKSRKAKGFTGHTEKIGEEKARKLDQQSWVRIVVKESALSPRKSHNGMLQQVQQRAPIEHKEMITLNSKIQAVEKVQNASKDLTPTQDNEPSVMHNCIPIASQKTKSIDFQGKVNDRDSTPSRPPKIHVSALSGAITTCRPSATVVSESNQCIWKLSTDKVEGYNVVIAMSVLIIIMGFLLLSGKFVAIVCASIWWYAIPNLRRMAKFEDRVNINRTSNKQIKSSNIKSIK